MEVLATMPKYSQNATHGSKLVAKQVARKFAFTERRIAKLPRPTNGQRAYYYDSATRGLAVAISPLGKMVFVLYRKVAGRPERVTIGPVSDLTIEQARGRAYEMNGIIAMGGNPAEERRSVRAEMTLQELWDMFLAHSKERRRESTWKNYQSMFEKHLHHWRFKKLFEIREGDVSALHSKIGRTAGKHAANRVAELLSAMFNRARKDWHYKGINPTTSVEAFPEEARRRFLGDRDEKEPARFFKALKSESQLWQDFFATCIYTGARCGDVERMQWSEVNQLRGIWTISAESTKGKKTIDIALPPEALEILKRRAASAKTPWVFPSPRKSKSGHVTESKAAWGRVLENGKITDLRLHDLRHTLGAFMAASGASQLQIGKQLGHAPGSPATKVYEDFNLTAVRSFLHTATAAMRAAGDAKQLEAKNG
jgi:integrase